MELKDKKLNKSERIGQLIFIGSLIFYFLIKLPFNLSVLCSNTNEGFYFVFGQHFLNGTDFSLLGRPYLNLYVLFYSLVLKIFGFNTYSIIAIHFIQTFVFILICILIYGFLKRILESSVYSSLAVLFGILLQITPIGQWGNKMELESAFALEAEYFVLFFYLCSIYTLIFGIKTKSNVFFLASGFFAFVAFMFKPSGAVLCIAYICWLIFIFFFDRQLFNELKIKMIFLFFGIVLSAFLMNLILYFIFKIDLLPYWKYYLFVGSYSTDFTKTESSIFLSIWNFMTRYTNSISNFTVFFLTVISIGWSLIRINFLKYENQYYRALLPLLVIITIGNICTVIAPGGYGAYYYILIWPFAGIFLVFGLRDIFYCLKFKGKLLIIFLIVIFFLCRLILLYPAYFLLANNSLQISLFSQPESFEDPVLIRKNNYSKKRSAVLKTADLINNLLPNKNDTVYVLGIKSKNKNQYFPVTVYIYMKRLCASTAVSDYFYYKNYLSQRLRILRKDLVGKPPKILILPHIYYLDSWQTEYLPEFLNWLNNYVSQNYKFKFNLNFNDISEKGNTIYDVYERT